MKEEIQTKYFTVDTTSGLSYFQVNLMKEKNEINLVKDTNGKSYLKIIFGNLFTFFNMLMIGVAACELIFCGFNMITNMSFLLLMISNTLIGTIQECHSKRAIDKLKLLNDSKVIVRRNSKEIEILPSQVVLSDIIILKVGDQIPADLEILDIDGNEVEVNESLLTGESKAVKKRIGEKLLAGSYIISGKCVCYAEKVGIDTYLNSIEMKAKNFKKPQSKLMISISRIIKILAIISTTLSFLVFWNRLVESAETLKNIYFIWDSFGKPSDFMSGSLLNEPVKWAGMTITYMIPAGMVLLSSVAMASGVITLASKKALTKDLYSVESLSRIDTLCLDKTGTLTDGTMTVIEEIKLSTEYSKDDFQHLISSYLSAFANENQTSLALVKKYGKQDYFEISNKIEFSSERKYSAVEFLENGIFALGAPEYLTKDKTILNRSKEYAEKGMRVLLLVKCTGKFKEDKLPLKKEPFAIFVIRDNIRPEVKATLEWFRKNDVDVRIISGDNVNTVSYIAKESGVIGYDKTFDMSTLTENDNVEKIVMETKVFGRVSPEQKAMIIDILKEHGRTVAMTGDGINDIIALKKADCSIALANGAPATKNIANIVLLDSNFNNMKNAVFEGRRVVNNIQRSSTLFVMKDFLWLFITVLPLVLGLKPVIESTVMTMVNTMITGVGSVFLALEPDRTRIKGSFIKNVLSRAIVAGFFMFIPVIACYIYAFISNGFEMETVGRFAGTFKAIGTINDMMPVMAICVSVAGFIVFANTCRPFTKYRKIVYGVILGLVVLALLAAPELFLINGTQYLEALRARNDNNIWLMIKEVINGLFSLKLYKEQILPNPGRWIFILTFVVLSAPLYFFTDKYLTRLLEKTMFNTKRFEDIKEEN